MDADSPALFALANRVDRLERRVRKLRTSLALALVAAAAFAGLAARTPPPTVLTAERLVLRGERGRGRAEFAVVDGNRLRITMEDRRWLHTPGGDSVPVELDRARGIAGMELIPAGPELRLTDGDHNPVLRLGPLERRLR